MQEVLDILVDRLPPPPLSATETRSIDKYRETRKQIVAAVNEAKQDDGDRRGTAEFERWLDALAALRDSDPERFADYADRLKDFVTRTPPKRPTARRGPPPS